MIRSIASFLCFITAITSTVVHAQDLNDVIESSNNTEAFWSVTVRDAEGEILFERNSDKLFIPASNQKLYTLGAVLHYLGKDFRYETVLKSPGFQEGDTWKGDIIIRGSGDPSISGFLYEENRYYVFESWYQQLKEQGINRIEGDLIGDISYFDDQNYPVGWDWYDLSFYYGVEIAPLSFNNNTVDLEVFAEGDVGARPVIRWFPDSTDYVDFINEQLILPENREYDEYYRRDPGTNRIILRSGLPRGYYETESLSVHDAGTYFVDSFKDFIRKKGIEWIGNRRTEKYAESRGNYKTLARHLSRPMSDLLTWANKESDNFYTEMFLKTLHAELSGEPGSFEGGIELVKAFLAETATDTSYVIMRDGSGLAYGNFTTTSNLSHYLSEIRNREYYDTLYESLPVAGIDGTIAYRMKDTPLYRNFRGKTGYMSGVRALSGYLTTKKGKDIIVSIATNNFAGKVKPVDQTHEQILLYLYENY
ncbi:D-alanyl-D-alanine carboxypeptidase/D-alanyl-D-alanine-endopeptidase [Balneola sp. MJW-20]|uniref:D-alanyl-D-alanine carboxypeptidase/D-alanyl-D-alanine endopeptidase n=1 Tax=Gracilimonas aurantiaca TaxID=3234185 RepID=UPI0034678FB4